MSPFGPDNASRSRRRSRVLCSKSDAQFRTSPAFSVPVPLFPSGMAEQRNHGGPHSAMSASPGLMCI